MIIRHESYTVQTEHTKITKQNLAKRLTIPGQKFCV
jgi:hypothetical protein